MYRLPCISKSKNIVNLRYFSINKSILDISDEVSSALNENKPVVALESTIITHGMPYPKNIECALAVENIIRSQGALPATIALMNGKIKVGLSKDEIQYLGDTKSTLPIKTSRRDFPYVISRKLNGGTTVSGTIIVCNSVGISVFATGGIGGVHRGASESFDISADLNELGRSNVAVVSSGVKSILDIPKTLEYLETQGVFVATLGDTNQFPAFYSKSSGFNAPYCVRTTLEAAQVMNAHRAVGLQSGLLFAVPVPERYALSPESINKIIAEAVRKADSAGIRGKEVTPFLLSEIAVTTGGNSLETNIALIKNNAKVAADIAVHLNRINQDSNNATENELHNDATGNRPVIIGGSNLDCIAHLDANQIKISPEIVGISSISTQRFIEYQKAQLFFHSNFFEALMVSEIPVITLEFETPCKYD